MKYAHFLHFNNCAEIIQIKTRTSAASCSLLCVQPNFNSRNHYTLCAAFELVLRVYFTNVYFDLSIYFLVYFDPYSANSIKIVGLNCSQGYSHRIEQVQVAKLLGVFFGDNSNYCTHVSTVLKLCAQRLYLLRLLRSYSQGLSRHNLNIVFQALVISRIVYCLPVWGGYITADQRGQINALFRRAYTRGFCLKVHSIEDLLDVADNRLFKAMQSSVQLPSSYYAFS